MHQCTIATKTYRVVFNMKDYGAPTKKPTMLLTNSRQSASYTMHKWLQMANPENPNPKNGLVALPG